MCPQGPRVILQIWIGFEASCSERLWTKLETGIVVHIYHKE